MSHEQEGEIDDQGSLIAIVLLAPVVGAVAGAICAVFRLLLQYADVLRNDLIDRAGDLPWGMYYVIGGCALTAAIAAGLVRWFSPQASGSGIPHVEAVLEEKLPQAPFRLIIIKFVGGLLSIGGGLALGREGPSVQMGASMAHLVGYALRRSWPECRVLLAAGAGAGLATAFNAPIAGAIFVLEELVRRFEPRIAIAALGASAAAIAVARLILGGEPDFSVPDLVRPGTDAIPYFVLLGLVAGVLACVYNWSLLATLALADWLRRVPVEIRAAVIGAAVGALAWYAPALVGGGDNLTQRTLAGGEAWLVLPIVFAIRLVLGAFSYAAGTPGGLFAPMLVLGAQIGLFVGIGLGIYLPEAGLQPVSFAVVGMAAFFTGVVRAPLTGIVLVTEMTANVTLLLPMLAACFAAMLVPSLLRNPPIYTSLRELILRHDRKRE
ncbi:MAG TPA: H(+)/Cl(-) exchange transporter ClcA [Xanthobacteraceae bacterium]|nr:H(+)/Cl(-) exchange transporter ClcA [Xanthobacteraceae bacterium]